MRALVSALLLSFGWAAGAYGQNTPTLQWQRQVGNRGTESERELALLRLSNNRLVVMGSSSIIVPPPALSPIRQTLWYFNQRGDSIRTVYIPNTAGNVSEGFETASALPNADMLLVGIGGTLTSPDEVWHTLTRVDSLGNVRWRREYNRAVPLTGGTSAYSDNQYTPPLLLPDGGALLLFDLVMGQTNPNNGTAQTAVARVDSVGNLLWQRTYGQPYSALYSIAALDDGSYALAGYQLRVPPGQQRLVDNGLLIRIDLDGNIIRSTLFGPINESTTWTDIKALPNGNVLLAGGYITDAYANPPLPVQGLLMQVDSTDQVVWRKYVNAAQPSGRYGTALHRLELVQGGDFVVQGWRYQSAPGVNDKGYLARWHLPNTPGGQPTPAWELQFPDARLTSVTQALWPDGSLTVGTKLPTPPGADPNLYYHPQLRHYAGVGRPVPASALCTTPPYPNAAATLSAGGDSLRLLEVSQPGPRYAQNVAWRWQLPGGRVLTQRQPPAQRVVPTPPAGTPVTFTVTNNLGCAATQVLYPWGRPTATQAARELAAVATLHPNPATGRATLTLPQAPAGPVRVVVLNALGQQVSQQTTHATGGRLVLPLELSGWAAGVYAVRVTTRAGSFAKRLVVE